MGVTGKLEKCTPILHSSFRRDILYLHCFTEAALARMLRNTTRKVRPCQIGDTLFGDCTRTLLSPSGVSEET